MKILGVCNSEVITLKARRININGNIHYNLMLGSKSKIGWEYRVSVSDSIVTNDFKDNYMTLQSDYSIQPIITKGGVAKDYKGNDLYYITNCSKLGFDSSVLLVLWSKTTDKITTDCLMLGKGIEVGPKELTNVNLILMENRDTVIVNGVDTNIVVSNIAGVLTIR